MKASPPPLLEEEIYHSVVWIRENPKEAFDHIHNLQAEKEALEAHLLELARRI